MKKINRWISVIMVVSMHFARLHAQEDMAADTQEMDKVRWPRYKATSLVKVVGGNLPKSVKDDNFYLQYAGRIVDTQGVMRLLSIEFRPDKQEYNRWLAIVVIDGMENVEIALQEPTLREWEEEHNQLWLDFNNYGQLSGLMDMSGMVRDTDEAIAYVRYKEEDNEGTFMLHFGLFSSIGNYLTQYKGRAMATLVADGYKK